MLRTLSGDWAYVSFRHKSELLVTSSHKNKTSLCQFHQLVPYIKFVEWASFGLHISTLRSYVFLLWIDSASGTALEIELREKSRYRGPSFLSLWSGTLADEAEQAQRNQTSNWKLKEHASSKQTTTIAQSPAQADRRIGTPLTLRPYGAKKRISQLARFPHASLRTERSTRAVI